MCKDHSRRLLILKNDRSNDYTRRNNRSAERRHQRRGTCCRVAPCAGNPPEKRDVFIQQLKMSRAFTALGASVTPPRSADQAIWSSIAAIDSAMQLEPANTAPVEAVATAPLAAASGVAAASAGTFLWMRMALLGTLLIGFGLGAGYLLWHNAPATVEATAQTQPLSNPSQTILAGIRDSLHKRNHGSRCSERNIRMHCRR